MVCTLWKLIDLRRPKPWGLLRVGRYYCGRNHAAVFDKNS